MYCRLLCSTQERRASADAHSHVRRRTRFVCFYALKTGHSPPASARAGILQIASSRSIRLQFMSHIRLLKTTYARRECPFPPLFEGVPVFFVFSHLSLSLAPSTSTFRDNTRELIESNQSLPDTSPKHESNASVAPQRGIQGFVSAHKTTRKNKTKQNKSEDAGYFWQRIMGR